MRKLPMLRRILTLGRRREGAAAVEFALCLLPLLLLIGGIIDFGQAWYTESLLTNISREGARYATRYTVNSTSQRLAPADLSPAVKDYVEGKYTSLLPGLNISLGGASTSTTPGDQVSVTATAPREWFFLGHLIPGLPTQLSSTIWMSLE